MHSLCALQWSATGGLANSASGVALRPRNGFFDGPDRPKPEEADMWGTSAHKPKSNFKHHLAPSTLLASHFSSPLDDAPLERPLEEITSLPLDEPPVLELQRGKIKWERSYDGDLYQPHQRRASPERPDTMEVLRRQRNLEQLAATGFNSNLGTFDFPQQAVEPPPSAMVRTEGRARPAGRTGRLCVIRCRRWRSTWRPRQRAGGGALTPRRCCRRGMASAPRRSRGSSMALTPGPSTRRPFLAVHLGGEPAPSEPPTGTPYSTRC
jgi:hypothetical protein